MFNSLKFSPSGVWPSTPSLATKLAITVAICLGASAFWFLKPAQSKNKADLLEYVREQEKIIRSSRSLRTRARPNERLKHYFGVSNGFTTAEHKVRITFSNDAVSLMKKAIGIGPNDESSSQNWMGLWTAAKKYSAEFIKHHSQPSLNLARLVQYVTLKVSVLYLFADDDRWQNALENPNMGPLFEQLGKEINDTWIASKHNDGSYNNFINSKLYSILNAIIPGIISPDPGNSQALQNPEDNPMNWLLPAYETMWRVVMRCVIEILYRGWPRGSEWRMTLQDYLTPTDGRISGAGFKKKTRDSASAINIVKEALRLYPPSRRIHRHIDSTWLQYVAELLLTRLFTRRLFDSEGNPAVKKADIEKCHHSKLFGRDPLIFRPERWENIEAEHETLETTNPTEHEAFEAYRKSIGRPEADLKTYEQYLGFMPFAKICPSDKTETYAFGMRMIALLTGVLCNALSDWKLEDENALPAKETPLSSDREAYPDLTLVRSS